MLRLEVNGPALRPRPTSPHPRRPPAPDLLLSRSQLLRVLPFSEPEPQKSVVGVTVLHCLELKHSKSHFQYEECGFLCLNLPCSILRGSAPVTEQVVDSGAGSGFASWKGHPERLRRRRACAT